MDLRSEIPMLLLDMLRLVREVFDERESPISLAPIGPMLLKDKSSVEKVVFALSDSAIDDAPEDPILALVTVFLCGRSAIVLLVSGISGMEGNCSITILGEEYILESTTEVDALRP